MPELVDDVLELLAPWPSANALAREIGFDSATSAATAAQLAVPLIVAGMVHRLNDPDDSAALIEIVRDVDTSGLHDFGSTLTDRAYEPTGSQAVQRILGDRHQSVAVKLAPEAECPEDSAINVFPPMAWAVTGLIAKRNGREHNRHSLLQIIRNEHDGLLRTGWGEWMSAVAPDAMEADHAFGHGSADGEPVDALVAEDRVDGQSLDGESETEDGVATLDVPVNEGPSRYPPPMPRTSRLGDGDQFDAEPMVAQTDTRVAPPNEFTATAELTPSDLPGTDVTGGSVEADMEDTVLLDEGAHANLAAELRRTVDGDVDDAIGDGSDGSRLDSSALDDPTLDDTGLESTGLDDTGLDDTVIDAELVDGLPGGGLDEDGVAFGDGLGSEHVDGVMAGDPSTETDGEEGLLEHLEQAIAELEADDPYAPNDTRRYEVQPVADVDLDAVVQDAVVPYERDQGESQSLLPTPRSDVPVVRREASDLPDIESLPPLTPGSELSAYLPPGVGMPDEVVPSPQSESGMGFSEFADDHHSSGDPEPVKERALGSTGPTWTAVAIGLLLLGVAVVWFLTEDRITPTVEDGAAVADASSFDVVLEGDGGASAQAALVFDSTAEEFCYDVSSTGLGATPAVELGQGQVGAGAPIVNVDLAGAEDGGCVPMGADVIASVLADPAGHYLTVAGADVSVGSQLTQ